MFDYNDLIIDSEDSDQTEEEITKNDLKDVL